MEEIRNKRTLNSKHFPREDNLTDGKFYSGPIHYFNKLGVGDSINDYRTTDLTLSFDEVKRGWKFEYNSFQPFLPEYADQWVEFRDVFDNKDQTIKYKAHASHTLGRLVQPETIGMEKETSANCVIYDNAFGEGMDYILYFTAYTLRKVVRIRDGYKPTTDTQFTWDIDFGNLPVFRADSKEQIAYELDTTRSKEFDTGKQTLIGDSSIGGEWATYLMPFRVWDSGEIKKTETVIVDYNADVKTITKNITADFLTTSFGDIITDTTTSFSPAYDGYFDNDVSTWSAAQGNSSSTTVDNTSQQIRAGAEKITSTRWLVSRAAMQVDTSAIGTDTITAASFIGYIWNTDWAAVVTDTCNIVSESISNTTLVTSDFNKTNFGTTSFGSVLNTSFSNDAMITITMSDYSGINKTGTSKIGLRFGNDIANTDPGGGRSFVAFHSMNSTTTAKRPSFSITYGPVAISNGNFLAFM
jgi:hypothetical protein